MAIDAGPITKTGQRPGPVMAEPVMRRVKMVDVDFGPAQEAVASLTDIIFARRYAAELIGTINSALGR